MTLKGQGKASEPSIDEAVADELIADFMMRGRVRDAERAALAAAKAVTSAHDALNVATHRDTKRNLVAKRDRATLEMFKVVRELVALEAKQGKAP